MRVRTGWFLAIPLAIALATLPAGCPKSSSRPKGTVSPRIQSAAFTDVNVSLSVDAGDRVVVTFDADVDVVVPSPTAASVFSLPLPTDAFGTSTVIPGPLSTQVTVQVAAGAGFNPVGVYPGSPGSSGIDVRSGQTGITYDTGTAVVSFGTPVDIAGSFNLGQWISLTNMMSAPRVGHSATVLESGEILIAGGLTNANSPLNPAFREALSSMEIFDPLAGTFTVTASMVRPRAFHQAIRTPGLDNTMGSVQNDDYVVMIGGWNSELTANNGPASDASVEVIVPDPNGDGDTSDLVANPNPTGVASGIGVPTGAVVAENGPTTFGGIAVGGGDAMIPPGMQHGDYDWGPELFISGAIGITTGAGTGNNEIFGLGGFGAWVWNDNLGQQDLFTIFTVDYV
ncbi:MAG: kelch repeat-containing protein, partial [Planctomycetota bacterium]|nr:kelch repeat-containing protein [Planctomycetota bacterium]